MSTHVPAWRTYELERRPCRYEAPDGGGLPITLIQGKCRTDRRGDAAFPENAIARIVDAIGALFDPEKPVTLNSRLNLRVEDIRSFVKDGANPRVTAVAANNGARWTGQAQQRIDNTAHEFGELAKELGPEIAEAECWSASTSFIRTTPSWSRRSHSRRTVRTRWI